MIDESRIVEKEKGGYKEDPDETPIDRRKVITQPYDLVIESLMDQVEQKTVHMRPLEEGVSFQRRYVWPNRLASRLIESILLNVPIPPCYLSQDEDFKLDIIDGQQRIFSIYRYTNNRFRLSNLEVLKELNGKRFFELEKKDRLKITTHTLRCVIITNDSDREIKFDVFERLNTNTVPLNAQELRNCIYRGALMDLLWELAQYEPWLNILGRKKPDNRMRVEELILRFFAFHINGLDSYRTPQKHWLNDAARDGQEYSHDRISDLATVWRTTIDRCLIVFPPHECFRRIPLRKSKVINRALMDLTMYSLAGVSDEGAKEIAGRFYQRYLAILQNEVFLDLISKSVDHRSRTTSRFRIWQAEVGAGLL